MDHYAADVQAVIEHAGERRAFHEGHSTGGGEALHYAVRHGWRRVAKLVLVGDDDEIRPITASAPPSVRLLRNGTPKLHENRSHGMSRGHRP